MLVDVVDDGKHPVAMVPCRFPRAQDVGAFSLFHMPRTFGSVALGYASLEISDFSPSTVSAQVSVPVL